MDRRELEVAIAQAGGRLMHDGDEHEIIAFRTGEFGSLERFVARVELEGLHRFFNLAALARVQALHLTATREGYVLREYIDQALFAQVCSMDAVEAELGRRIADKSERVARLRMIANPGPWWLSGSGS